MNSLHLPGYPLIHLSLSLCPSLYVPGYQPIYFIRSTYIIHYNSIYFILPTSSLYTVSIYISIHIVDLPISLSNPTYKIHLSTDLYSLLLLHTYHRLCRIETGPTQRTCDEVMAVWASVLIAIQAFSRCSGRRCASHRLQMQSGFLLATTTFSRS